MKKKIVRIGLYSGFALFSYLTILLYTFPYNSLTPFLSDFLLKKTDLNITVGSVGPFFPLGIQAGTIRIQDKKGDPLYTLDAIQTSIPIGSIFSTPPPISYRLKKKESSIYGIVSQKNKKNISLSFQGKSSQVSELIDDLKPIPFVTKLDGEIDLNGEILIPIAATRSKNIQALDLLDKGNLSLLLTNLTVSLSDVPIPGLPQLLISRLECKAKLQKGRLTIEKATVQGDIQGSVKGDIIIRNPFKTSRIDLRVRFKPSPKLEKKTSMLLSLLSRKKGQGGFYNIDLKGTLEKIKPIF